MPETRLSPGPKYSSTKKIALCGKNGDGLFALVDEDDYVELVKYSWYCASNGYVIRTEHYKNPKTGKRTTRTIYMHRQITKCPNDKDVDHKNHDRKDNRKSNLRICTKSENQRNNRAKGYYFDKKHRNFVVTVKEEGKYRKRCFKTEEEAKKAVNLVRSGYAIPKKIGYRNKYLPKNISRYYTKGGVKYYYRYYVGSIVYRKGGFPTIEDALRELNRNKGGK